MPRLVSEIAPGTQYQFSANEGGVGSSLTRVFRILLNFPQEYVDLAQECNIRAGDPHPTDPFLRCTNYEGQFEGDSRMVIIATFTFTADVAWGGEGGGGSGGGKTRLAANPEIRPANWSVSSSVMEVPAYTWQERTAITGAFGPAKPAANPVGDMYDGVTRTVPLVTISIEQFEDKDPTEHVLYVGDTNKEIFKIGSLLCPRRTVMLRSVQSRAVVEKYGDLTYRGWNVTYEFVFKRNRVEGLSVGNNNNATVDVGWDIAVPQTGMNIKNTYFPSVANAESSDVEAGSLLLQHEDYKIKGWPSTIGPAEGTGGEKTRGMILVHEYEAGGASQLPSAQPIPLNNDGTPRWNGADPKVLVKVYKVTDETDFKAVFKLRLD